jgi:cytochrome c-type biogenesis protein CcmF
MPEMHPGTILLGVFFAAAVLFLVLMLVYRFTGATQWRRYARFAMVAGFGSLSASFLLLVYSFMISDFSIHQVWEYSGRDLDWWLKLSGSWAGRSGSILLWTWLMVLSIFIEDMASVLRKPKDEPAVSTAANGPGVRDWTMFIAMIPAVVFGIVLLSDSPFLPVHPISGISDPLESFPDGLGLNPLLRTFWMVVHPPLLFLGYAFITIPFAAGIANGITRDRSWTDMSLKWSRAAWIFLTLGIGIGAVWAYVVLGWGGYWGWDPVEVSSLVPWVTLTAFLHAQLKNRRVDEYRIFAPALGLATFVLVVFATFVTRGGAWNSVHAWESGDVTTYSYLGLLFGTLILGSIAILRNLPKEEAKDGSGKRSQDPAMYATVILLGVGALVLFIGVLVNQGALKPEYYETRLFPVMMALALALGLCLAARFIKKMEWYYVVGWMLLFGIIGAVLLPRVLPGKDGAFYELGPLNISRLAVAGFILPSLLFSLAASVLRIIRHVRGGLRAALNGVGPHIAHLGVALVLIGYVATNAYNDEATLTLSSQTSVDFEGYTFKLENVGERTEGLKEIREYTVSVSSGGQQVGVVHPAFTTYTDNNRTVVDVSILSLPAQDVYVVPSKDIGTHGGVPVIEMKVRTLPLPGLLWAGMLLLAGGLAARFAAPRDAAAEGRAGPKGVSPAELEKLDKDRLKELCRELGLDDRGSAAALRHRLGKRLRKEDKGPE